MNKPQTLPVDTFLYRLLAAINCGILLLVFGYGLNMKYQRIPNLQRVVESTKLESIGRGGERLFENTWVLVALPAAAAGVGLTALMRPGRRLLATAFALSFVTIAVTIAAEVVTTRVWTRVLGKLLQ